MFRFSAKSHSNEPIVTLPIKDIWIGLMAAYGKPFYKSGDPLYKMIELRITDGRTTNCEFVQAFFSTIYAITST